MKIKSFVLAVALAVISVPQIYAADGKEKSDKELEKERQKRIEAVKDSIDFVHASRAVADRHFVLQADQLLFSRGGAVSAVPSTNFVMVNGDDGIVQVSPRVGGGPNGVGGITVEGRLSGFKSRSDKKGNSLISFTVSGNGLSTQVDITLYAGSNRASARVTPTFRSGAVTLNGSLVPYDVSRVTSGSPLR